MPDSKIKFLFEIISHTTVEKFGNSKKIYFLKLQEKFSVNTK